MHFGTNAKDAYANVKNQKRDYTIEEKNEIKEEPATILDLYKKEKLTENIVLEKAVVIYKNEDKAIIKRANDRAIFVYKNAKDLKLGYSYNLQIHQIFDYYGLKEIKEFAILDEIEKVENYKSLFLDGANIDIFDFKYENEIITNLKGIVKNSKLYLDNGKEIKIYSNKRNLLPKNGETITILNGHLASYRGNMQKFFILHQILK